MDGLELVSVQPWAPHKLAAPLTERGDDRLRVSAYGTRTCVGGWQMTYSGVTSGACYSVRWDVVHGGLDNARDSLRCRAYWGEMAPDNVTVRSGGVRGWHYLVPERTGVDTLSFGQVMAAPEGAEALTLRCAFRWTAIMRTRAMDNQLCMVARNNAHLVASKQARSCPGSCCNKWSMCFRQA